MVHWICNTCNVVISNKCRANYQELTLRLEEELEDKKKKTPKWK